MGYTHYWTQKRDFTESQFLVVAKDVRRILEKSGVPLADGSGTPGTAPEITGDKIWFNGVGPKDDHETMVIDRTRPPMKSWQEPDRRGWAFCKTARKPYDKAVTAVLAYLAARWGYEVASDGYPEEWADGVALAKKALPEIAGEIVCPIKADA